MNLEIATLELLLAFLGGTLFGTVTMMVNYGAVGRLFGTAGDQS
jgi:hypothetical protein